MYSAAFIFRPGIYDDEFRRLNAQIDKAAKATDGYHIVVSEVIRSYGDDVIAHLTPNSRKRGRGES